MKVYVMTKFVPFGDDIYVCVKNSKKEAEEYLRHLYPHMKPTDSFGTNCAYVTKENGDVLFLAIKEEEI